jgi:ribosomal protein L7/L12
MTRPGHPLPPNVLDALEAGQTIDAIQQLRKAQGIGLKEAKDLIDAHLRGEGVPLPTAGTTAPQAMRSGDIPDPVRQALAEGNRIEAIRLLRDHEGLGLKEAKERVDALEQRTRGAGLAPGEQPRVSGLPGWIVAAVVLAVAGLYLLQRAG